MREKRFRVRFEQEDGRGEIVNEKGIELTAREVVDCLNEQQDIINKRLDQIIELQDKYRILEFNHSRLEKRNKAQYEKIDEQQAIINKQERRIMVLENLLTNIGVKWVDDDE